MKNDQTARSAPSKIGDVLMSVLVVGAVALVVVGIRDFEAASKAEDELRDVDRRKLEAARSLAETTSAVAELDKILGSTEKVIEAVEAAHEKPTKANADPLYSNPEYRRLIDVQTRAQLDLNYSLLMRRLKLNPTEVARMKQLLTDRVNVQSDAARIAIAQKTAPKTSAGWDEFYSLATSVVDQEIRSSFGEDRFKAFLDYEGLMPQRRAVNEFARQLRYTDLTLSDEQEEVLVQLLRDVSNVGTLSFREIPETVVVEAGKVLNPSQVEYLTRYRQQRQAYAKMAQLVSEKAKR